MNIHKPNSLSAIDKATMVHPYTDLTAHNENGPHIITQGSGVFLKDEDGKQFIDAIAGLWCSSLGSGQDRLIAAATKQMEELAYSHTFAHRSHPVVIELAERLTAMAPPSITRTFFVNSGSEAVDSAIQIVWYYNNALGRPEKKKIIGRERGYHGVTIGAGSLTALPYKQVDFDLPVNDRFLRVSCPHFYRYGMPGESEADFSARLIEEVEQRILEEGPDTVAAFIGEPVMAAGGVIPPPEGYWAGIAALCKKYDMLLIADEVVNGFGRTGKMWGSQTVGIEPDIMTSAKQLSSAYLPIGATLLSEEVFSVIAENSAKYGTFGIGMTYGGHPVCAAVALETLKIYEEIDIVDRVGELSRVFQDRLNKLAEHPLVGEARGVGLIGAIELVSDKETREQFPAEVGAAKQLYANVLDAGVSGRPLPGDAFALCPPLVINEQELGMIFDAVEKGLDLTEKAIHAA